MLLDAGTVASSGASSGKSSTATSGDAGLLATLHKPRASSCHQTPQSLATHPGPFRQPHDHEARTNLKPPPSFPTDDPQTPSASLPAPTTCANGMTTEARTNLGPPAASPTHTPRNTHRLVTRSGHGDNLRPDVQTHLGPPPASPTDGPQTVHRRPKASLPISGSFDDAMTTDHRCRNKTRASSNRRRRTIIGLSAASTHLGPRRQPATSTSRHTSGHRHLLQQTVQRLAAHFGHFPATATTCHADIQTHLGPLPFSPADGLRAHCPNLSTTDGPQITAATAAIAAASGKSGVPSPTRRTSPIMTNKRVKSVLELARNTAVMAPPSAAPYPAEYPAALPQSLPQHPAPPL